MYTYKANCLGYTVYKNNIPVYKAGVLAKTKRYNKRDAIDNENAAKAHIRLLIALDDINK